MRGLKKLGSLLIMVIAIGFLAYTFIFGERGEEIEDINGADDYSLAVITEANIIAQDVLPTTEPTRSKNFSIGGISFGDSGVKFSCKEFSGIYLLASGHSWGGVTYEFRDLEVRSGNFQICLVWDDEIVATIDPSTPADDFGVHRLQVDKDWEDDGEYKILLVGESAAFSFYSDDFGSEVDDY